MNTLFCVTGPSGSGKTTVMRNVMDRELLSFTTREMREGEVEGKDYNFISKEQFNKMYEDGELAEWTEYGGNFYGLTMEEIDKKLVNGDAFFICDNNGYNQIKDAYPKVISIFIYADRRDCMTNMKLRGDTYDRVEGRLVTYEEEMSNTGQYDYVIRNNRGLQYLTDNILEYIVRSEIRKNNRKVLR